MIVVYMCVVCLRLGKKLETWKKKGLCLGEATVEAEAVYISFDDRAA